MSDIHYTVSFSGPVTLTLDVPTANAWERDPAVRAEVRRDAALISRALRRPVEIVDPTDPVPGRICERVDAGAS